MQIFFLAPVTRDAGLTSMALGLVQALRRDHVAVGFIKPIMQPVDRGSADLATHFARSFLNLDVPDPIPYAVAEARVRAGGLDALLEDLVASVEAAGAGCDAVVVEGLTPDAGMQIATRLNAAMARAFSAALVPVLSGSGRDPAARAAAVELALHQFAEAEEPPPIAGVLINHLHAGPPASSGRRCPPTEGAGADVPVLGEVPFEPRLAALRLQDVRDALGLGIEQEGALAHTRVLNFVIAGRGVEGVIDRLRPGSLVVAAGERSDIVLASGLVYMQGMPLAGVLLTCGTRLPPQIAALVRAPGLAGLPILTTQEDTFATGALLAGLSHHVRADDTERMDQAVTHAAENIDTTALRARIGLPGRLRMPPPAFRHRLVQAARAANKRIVLPEGDEPRTVQAAAICQRKGIARCVLLGEPDRVRDVADRAGHHLAGRAGNHRSRRGARALRRADDRSAARQRPHRGAGGAPAGGQRRGRHHDAGAGRGGRAGLRRRAHHGEHHPARPAIDPHRAGCQQRLQRVLHADAERGAGLRRLRREPRPDGRGAGRHRHAVGGIGARLRHRPARRHDLLFHRHLGHRRRCGQSAPRAGVARAMRPELLIDGPMQYDAASVESVGRQKAPNSPVAGRASVFVFPDLNTGNTTYKAVQRSANVISIGPMLQGLRKPVNDLSRGALVDDIVYTIALTAIQAKQAEKPPLLVAAE